MKFIILMLAQLCLAGSLHAASEFTSITDKKGRSIRVKLITHNKTHVKCSKKSSKQVISIPFSKLDQKSIDLVKKKLEKQLQELADNPRLNTNVVIKKRRTKERGNSYMRNMSITAKVSAKNVDIAVDATECKGYIFLVGRDQRDSDTYSILLNQKFKITPTHDGAEFLSSEVETSYDSDNKGEGNIGGFKYCGYVLFITSQSGKILSTKTTMPRLNDSLTPKFLQSLSKLKKGTEVDRYLKY